jgi:transmembrane sensor
LSHPLDAVEIEAQAAAWLIRVEADNSAATLAQWQHWLNEDARHYAAYVRIERGWRRTDCLKKLRPPDGNVKLDVLDTFPGLHTSAPPRAPFRPKIWHLTGAGSLAIVTMALATWFHAARPEPGFRRTGLGGFERAVLPDGSTVLLNTNSEIRLHFTPRLRQVVLTRGEALFTVAHATGRPFDVTAGRTTVRAIGTSFAIRLRSDAQTEIIVARGKVAVSPESATTNWMLTAGDDLRVDTQGHAATARLATGDIDHRLAWTRGQIWLDQSTLAEAVAEFNRYNSRRFILADPELANLRVGGSFAATDPTAFIAALERVFGIRAVAAEDISGAPIIRLLGPGSDAQLSGTTR